VPTAAGALLFAALFAACALGSGRAAYPLLAPDAAAGAGVLVVEGWAGGASFDAAAQRFARGGYASVVTAGGPIELDSPLAGERTWAEYAASALLARGVPAASVHAVPAPASAQDRTFLSAVMVREWLAAQGEPVESLDVITDGPHGRRSWILYRLAFGDAARVGIVSVAPTHWDGTRWWRSSEGARAVLSEAIGVAWTLCCFDPGARGSHEEKWATPPRAATNAAAVKARDR
jgi:hypothetical protein